MIYIIRPQASAKETQMILAKIGHICHILPITQIIPQQDNILFFKKALREKRHHIIFTSGNAFAGLSYEDYTPYHHQVYCVGEKTAQKAREYGFENIKIANPENIQGLTECILADKPSLVLYAAGKQRKPYLETTLKDNNILCVTYPLYEAQIMQCNDNIIFEKLFFDPEAYILCFSLRHAQLFYGILCHSGLDLDGFHRLRWHIIGEKTIFDKGIYHFYHTPQELYSFFANHRPII